MKLVAHPRHAVPVGLEQPTPSVRLLAYLVKVAVGADDVALKASAQLLADVVDLVGNLLDRLLDIGNGRPQGERDRSHLKRECLLRRERHGFEHELPGELVPVLDPAAHGPARVELLSELGDLGGALGGETEVLPRS